MAIQFVNTFLFACPECQLPWAITRLSEKESLESVGNGTMKGYCASCGKARYGSRATARRQYVDEWEQAKAAGHG